MIKSFINEDLETCWLLGRCGKVPATLRRRVLMKLDMLDFAVTLTDIENTPGCRLHKLKGKRKGEYALSINGPWRLIFKYKDGAFFDIKMEQYH